MRRIACLLMMLAAPAFADEVREACRERVLRATFGALREAARLTAVEPSHERREALVRAWLGRAGERGSCPKGGLPFALFVDPAGRFRVACPAHDYDLHDTPRGTRFLPEPRGDLTGRVWLRGRPVEPPKRERPPRGVITRDRTPEHDLAEAKRLADGLDRLKFLSESISATHLDLHAARDEARRALDAYRARRSDPFATPSAEIALVDRALDAFHRLRILVAHARDLADEAVAARPDDADRTLATFHRERVNLPAGDLRALADRAERIPVGVFDLPGTKLTARSKERDRRREEEAANCRAYRRDLERAARGHGETYGSPPAGLFMVDPRLDGPDPVCPSGGGYRIDDSGKVFCSVHE